MGVSPPVPVVAFIHSQGMEAETRQFWIKRGPTGSQGEIRNVLSMHESQTGMKGREVEMSSTTCRSAR